MVRDLAQDQKTVKTESAQIEGFAKAYYTPDKTLAILLGTSPMGSPYGSKFRATGSRRRSWRVCSAIPRTRGLLRAGKRNQKVCKKSACDEAHLRWAPISQET